jgi:hypothetical protein
MRGAAAFTPGPPNFGVEGVEGRLVDPRRRGRGRSAGVELIQEAPDWFEAGRFNVVVALAAAVLGAGDPCFGEQAQMAADCRTSDGVRGAEVGDPRRAGRQLPDQVTPDGVGQGVEPVHPLLVTEALPIGQGIGQRAPATVSSHIAA